MVFVRLSGDADRKRLEYLLEKYGRKGGVRRICGGVVLADLGREDMEKFAEELYSRFGSDKVDIWFLAKPDFELRPSEYERVFRVRGPCSGAWVLVDFVMAKLRGVLVSESMSGASKVYRARTKLGGVEARFEVLGESGGYCRLLVRVSGYGPAAGHFFKRLVRELSPLEES